MNQQANSGDLFEKVERAPGCQTVWKHKTKPVWIVFYSAVEGVRTAFFQAYRAVQRVPAGRDPWTVDNRRIGNENHGYPTLEAAMEAAS